MTTGWGADHSHYDYAERQHGHGWNELHGVSPDTHDHHVDSISGAAHADHDHQISDVRKLSYTIAQLTARIEYQDGYVNALSDQVTELERDRNAMMRRLRILDPAWADELDAGNPPVELDELDDRDPREP